MPKLSELTEETTVAADDTVVIVDTSAGTTDKATVANLASSAAFTAEYVPLIGSGILGLRPANTATSYWPVPNITGASASNASLPSQGQLFLVPFVVSHPVTLVSMAAEVTTAGEAGAVLRFGVYADSPDGEHDMTAISLVVDLGTAAAATTGVKTATGSQALGRGVYWAGVVPQSCPTTAPSLRGWFDNHVAAGVPGNFGTSLTLGVAAVRAYTVTGALPDPPSLFADNGLSADRRTPALLIGVAA